MPIPTPPTILLAAGGLAMVVGRFLPIRFSLIWGWYFGVSLLLTACSLWLDPVALSAKTEAFDIHRVWTNDGLAVSGQWLALAFGFISGVTVFDSPLRTPDRWKTAGFLLFAVAGLMLVARANDLLSLGMTLEIVNLAMMAFARCLDSSSKFTEPSPGSTTDREGPLMSSRWLDWLVSGWMWFGIALLSNAVFTTQFDAMRLVLIDIYHGQDGQTAQAAPSKLILLAAGLIVMSLFGRMGLVPFHLGLGTGTRNRSTMSWGFAVLAGQLAGTMALGRLCGRLFVGFGQPLVVLMMVVCLVSFVLSSVMTVRGFSPGVRSIPRWLTSLVLLQSAWLGIGVIAAAMELEHPDARWGAFPQQSETLGVLVFSQFATLLSFAGIFGILGHLARVDRGIEFLEDLKGLGQMAPGAAAALFVSLASSIGCPWTSGFWGRWHMLLAGHSVHYKSTSSIFDPNGGVRFVMLAGIIATIFVASAVIRMFREMFLESPLARPTVTGGRGPLMAGMAVAIASLLLGVAPCVLFIPLRTIEAPREPQPESAPQGSGKNHSVFRAGFENSTHIFGSSCQARYPRQVHDHFLISTKLACCPWQSPICSAQFCPVWSGTSSPDHQPCEDNPFILVDPYS